MCEKLSRSYDRKIDDKISYDRNEKPSSGKISLYKKNRWQN